jgi:hypothetical protein
MGIKREKKVVESEREMYVYREKEREGDRKR